MRTARLLTGSALAAALLGLGGAPAYANNDFGGGVEVFPATASPGTTVTVNTTACGRDGHATGDARAVGDGEFHLSVSTHKEVLAGQFMVPHHAKPGTFEISVTCDNGKSARGDLTIAHGGESDRGGERFDHSEHGEHAEHSEPKGHVKSGVGGSVISNRTEIAAGAAVLAVAAVTGGLLLRRRAGAPDRRN
ncbi:hypothetical protein ACT1U9_21505 [Streptomyces sp. BR1]|uniref:hypothetical protein n=1 Tax=Streptomyces sp. BR1 TaxID=1592323 RepID=UPI00402B7DD2